MDRQPDAVLPPGPAAVADGGSWDLVFNAQTGTDGLLAHAAEVLAQALQDTPEWRQWQSAKAALESDTELGQLMAHYRELACHWRRAQARGGGLISKEAMELAEVQEKIQQQELFVRQQEAGGALVALFQRANDAISTKLGIDFAADAVPRSGGCCG